MKFDKYNLLVGIKEDPGDSCHRTCMYFLGLLWFRKIGQAKQVSQALSTLRVADGVYCRHFSAGWWVDGDRMSRDQATPLVILMGEYKLTNRLKGFFFAHLKRGFFFTNTRKNGATAENHGHFKYGPHLPEHVYDYSWKLPDFIGPEFLSIYIRAFNLKILYPLLLLFDFETLIGSVMWRWFKKEETDILNHLIVSEYSSRVMPTPISYLAKKLNEPISTNKRLSYYFFRVGLPEMALLWWQGD